MKARDEIMDQTLVKLRSIQTLKQYKAARKEIIELIRQIKVSAIDILKAFIENMVSMTPEEQQAEAAKFQDENFLISADVMQEVERLNNIPGAAEYAESFSLELEKIMKPQMEEFEQQMGKLMENLMGGIFGGITDAMDQVFSSGSEEPAAESETEFVYDEENPDMLYILYVFGLYSMKSLPDLEAGRDSIVENLEMEIDMHKSNLDNYFMPGTEVVWDADKRKISEIQKLIDRLVPELDSQLMRISNITGSAEDVGKIRDEMMSRLEPKINEFSELLSVKMKEWKKTGLL